MTTHDRVTIAQLIYDALEAQGVYVDGPLDAVLIDASGGDYADLLEVADAVLRAGFTKPAPPAPTPEETP